MNLRSHLPSEEVLALVRTIDPKGKETAILNAAVQEFTEKGYNGSSVSDIAKTANVSVGTIYRIFSSKEHLANRVYQHCLARYDEFRSDMIVQDHPPRKQFASVWQTMTLTYFNYPKEFIFAEFHFHGSFLDDSSRLFRQKLLERLHYWIGMQKQNSVLKDLPMEILLSLCRGAFLDIVKSAQNGEARITKKLVAQLEDACWLAIVHPDYKA